MKNKLEIFMQEFPFLQDENFFDVSRIAEDTGNIAVSRADIRLLMQKEIRVYWRNDYSYASINDHSETVVYLAVKDGEVISLDATESVADGLILAGVRTPNFIVEIDDLYESSGYTDDYSGRQEHYFLTIFKPPKNGWDKLNAKVDKALVLRNERIRRRIQAV